MNTWCHWFGGLTGFLVVTFSVSEGQLLIMWAPSLPFSYHRSQPRWSCVLSIRARTAPVCPRLGNLTQAPYEKPCLVSKSPASGTSIVAPGFRLSALGDVWPPSQAKPSLSVTDRGLPPTVRSIAFPSPLVSGACKVRPLAGILAAISSAF